jgi:hypothetical protein
MLMRCEPLNGSLSAEESVEPIPGQAEFLSGWLRLCTRKANSEISLFYGMQPPRRCPASKVRLLRIGFPSPVARAGLVDPDAGFPVL